MTTHRLLLKRRKVHLEGRCTYCRRYLHYEEEAGFADVDGATAADNLEGSPDDDGATEEMIGPPGDDFASLLSLRKDQQMSTGVPPQWRRKDHPRDDDTATEDAVVPPDDYSAALSSRIH